MSETWFRMTFGFLWLLFFGMRLYFQRRIPRGLAYSLVNQTQERRLFRAFAIGDLSVVLYPVTPWLDVAGVALPAWLRWLGGAVVCVGIGVFGWAHPALGRHWTAVLALSADHEMVTGGPYRYARHPMYAGFFLVGVGFSLLSANWLVAALYLGTLLPMYILRVSAEERMMSERFGDRYRQYMARWQLRCENRR